jgi:adenylate cyclase
MKRKIAAILAADIAGYSKLVADDEEETIARLGSYREVFDDLIKQYGGRIFNTAGDAVMAEFSSSVEAVRCAVDVQESLNTRNLAYPPERQMHFRIGITLGDVIERDGDLLGDGVNIAARLESLATPGGVCVSRSVYEQVTNKAAITFADIGEQMVKNIPSPIHAYVVGNLGAERPPVAPAAAAARGANNPAATGGGMPAPAIAAGALAAVGAALAALFVWQPWASAPPTAAPQPQRQAVAPPAPPPPVPLVSAPPVPAAQPRPPVVAAPPPAPVIAAPPVVAAPPPAPVAATPPAVVAPPAPVVAAPPAATARPAQQPAPAQPEPAPAQTAAIPPAAPAAPPVGRLTILTPPAGSSCQSQVLAMNPAFVETVVELTGGQPVLELDSAALCGLAIAGAGAAQARFAPGTVAGTVPSLSSGGRIVFHPANTTGRLPDISVTGGGIDRIELRRR